MVDGSTAATDATLSVIALINNLPENITLSDKEAVQNALSAFQSLPTDQQALVKDVNYEKLDTAIATIEYLETRNPTNPDTPDEPVKEDKGVDGSVVAIIILSVLIVALVAYVGTTHVLRRVKKVSLNKETPVEDTPVEEAKIEETVVEETKIEEANNEETPIEETKIEE